MARTADYDIAISNLANRLDGSLSMITDAARYYYEQLRMNISQFSKSGGLLNSWKFEVYNETEASVYSNLPYARSQDKGAKILITVRMRNFAWYKYYQTKDPKWKAIAITKKKYIELPAKNYSMVNFDLIKQILEINYPENVN